MRKADMTAEQRAKRIENDKRKSWGSKSLYVGSQTLTKADYDRIMEGRTRPLGDTYDRKDRTISAI